MVANHYGFTLKSLFKFRFNKIEAIGMKLVEMISGEAVAIVLDHMEVAHASFNLKLISRIYSGPKR